jgi:hypothetical protein
MFLESNHWYKVSVLYFLHSNMSHKFFIEKNCFLDLEVNFYINKWMKAFFIPIKICISKAINFIFITWMQCLYDNNKNHVYFTIKYIDVCSFKIDEKLKCKSKKILRILFYMTLWLVPTLTSGWKYSFSRKGKNKLRKFLYILILASYTPIN